MELSSQIRILDLLPIFPDEEQSTILKCDIRSVHLTHGEVSEEYEALSYVWGSQSDTVPILVSGQQVDVTRSLHAALRHLQLRDRKRALWVDQICINQSDPEEKAAQVPLMGNIYSSCSQCLAWLGDIPYQKGVSLEDAAAAFDLIRYIAAAAAATAKHPLESLIPTPSCLENHASSSHSNLEKVMRALRAMSPAENAWWSRIWTIQEAALSKRASILWGPLSLSWDTMRQATRVWTGEIRVRWSRAMVDLLRTPLHGDVFKDIFVHAIWLQITSSRSDCPLSLIRRWRGRLATDPRDKIYGLLGLMSPQGSLPSVEACSYTISVAQVYSMLTIDLIAYENGLRPLVNDPRVEADLATEDMPSWALDLRLLARWDTDWYHYYGYHWYKADHGLTPLDLTVLRTAAGESNNRTLRLRGIMIDVVQDVGPGAYVPVYGYRRDQVPSDEIRMWYQTAQQSGGNDQQKSFSRLILGDLVRDESQWPKRKASPEDIAVVREFLDSGSIDNPDLIGTIFGMTRNQTFFTTRAGLLGLGHLETKPGDQVWIFGGGQVPFTLRAREREQHDDGVLLKTTGEPDYDFVGRTYVQGIMQGEAFRSQTFTVQDEQSVRIY